MNKLVGSISVRHFFQEKPMIHFMPEIANTSACLHVEKTRQKTVATLDIGEFIAKETILTCPKTKKKYASKELTQLIPPLCKFGYDILVYVGKALFLDYLTDQQIMNELKKNNITISKSEIAYLAKRFIIYLTIIHQQSAQKLKEAMATRGGYILHLDGTCEGGSPHLMSGLDELSQFVLHNVKMPSEHSAHIIPFLKKIKDNYGMPQALVHDMGGAILHAIEKVFPGVADFICHFHFLRDIGKDLFQKEYDIIRKRLRKHGIISKLKRLATQLEYTIQEHPNLIHVFEAEIKNKQFSEHSLQRAPIVSMYALILWALDGKHQGQGYGFPFDRPHVVFTQRLHALYAHAKKMRTIPLTDDWRDSIPFLKVCGCLDALCSDTILTKTLAEIEPKIETFDKLREAMRITVSEQSQGLNDNGGDAAIKTIEESVIDFCMWLLQDERFSKNNDYQKMTDQIDKYWEKLFADPITVQTPQGKIIIQPQRTNNILERFFRDLKRGYRCKSKTNSMSKTLKAMLAQTPLVKNLSNPEYLNIILSGKETLEERFSEIDSGTIRTELKKSQESLEKVHQKIQSIIKDSDLPKVISTMFFAKTG